MYVLTKNQVVSLCNINNVTLLTHILLPTERDAYCGCTLCMNLEYLGTLKTTN